MVTIDHELLCPVHDLTKYSAFGQQLLHPFHSVVRVVEIYILVIIE